MLNESDELKNKSLGDDARMSKCKRTRSSGALVILLPSSDHPSAPCLGPFYSHSLTLTAILRLFQRRLLSSAGATQIYIRQV